jgi:hypothetical protein
VRESFRSIQSQGKNLFAIVNWSAEGFSANATGGYFGFLAITNQHFRALELNFKGSGRGPDGWMSSLGIWRALGDESSGRPIYQFSAFLGKSNSALWVNLFT